MDKTYYIEFKANPVYCVHAQSLEEAYESALEWFAEYLPQFRFAEKEGSLELDVSEIQNWSDWANKL